MNGGGVHTLNVEGKFCRLTDGIARIRGKSQLSTGVLLSLIPGPDDVICSTPQLPCCKGQNSTVSLHKSVFCGIVQGFN